MTSPRYLTANDLAAVGAPLTLYHLDLAGTDHPREADCATCREWCDRVLRVRTGHTFQLGLRHLQARELRDYVERVAGLNEEGAVLEALVYAAAVQAAPVWLEVAQARVAFAQRDLDTTRRDSYHYEAVLEDRKAEVAEIERLICALSPIAQRPEVAA